MVKEKRFYTRYSLLCECIVGFESGLKFEAEILDISVEGAQIRVDRFIPIKLGDIIYVNIRCKYKVKLKGEVRWVREDKFLHFGIKFRELSMKDREALTQLISEMALASLSDSYFR